MYGDPPGTHRFMFKFYGLEDTSEEIKARIEAHQSIGDLETYEKLRLDGFVTKGTRIRDDCDGTWPDEMKSIWPYYICGASKAWLKLVENITNRRKDIGSPPKTYPELIALYKEASTRADKIWAKHGGHAMLHHLFAVFGYKPVDLETQEGKTLSIVL